MGAALCVLSAASFGAMGIFGKLAYEEGVGVWELLLIRFGLAALVLGGVAALRGAMRSLGRRAVIGGLLMGCVGYATQAGLYFLALERMDASLLSLLLYTYPALVTGAEVISPFIDWSDPESAIYFGDGSGAAVLGRVPEGYGVLASDVFTEIGVAGTGANGAALATALAGAAAGVYSATGETMPSNVCVW